MKPIRGPLVGALRRIDLPFGDLPSRDVMATRARAKNSFGEYWKEQLRLHDQGTLNLPRALSLPVQAITFGDELCIVFLGGEVVVDYSPRLKRELDRQRLWVVAYANEVRAYIPSARVIAEGGYEAGGDIIYSALPSAFAPKIENRIVDAVMQVVPARFRIPARQ